MFNVLKKIYSIYNNAIAMAVISCIFGAFLLVFPVGSVAMLSLIIGTLLVLAGCALMGNYFLDQATSGFMTGLGLFPLIFGILLIANPRFFIDFIPTMFGIYVLFVGLGEVSRVSKVKSMGYDVKLSSFMAFSTVVVGVCCILFSWFVAKTAIRIVGAAIIYKGISRLIYDKNMKNKTSDFYDNNSDIIDGKFRD